MPPKRTNKKLAKEHNLDESDIVEIREAFELLASDSATIHVSSVRSAMSALGLEPSLEESRQITAHLTQLMSSQDSAGVTFDMFLDVVALKMTSRDKESEVDRAFELFDPKGTGKITIHDLRRIAKTLGETVKDQELTDMLEEAGGSYADGIDKHQFEQVMGRAGIW
ncbi:protein of unknown function [Taphrina deformans PYCC 5710]|uniref:EF-hand domain-containing protein n=1 Tax=Taphrina deformans (strain PYCC 5710 / ATCC 11124 / CBS 356.35 / IMI 108563 / JCM 9778 / NBRC 8474) TaxID=1097556 RepID=R4XF74_TAPDE|nr:protein of unknown function [Taphrina deformans PYCC 5710]|eukprot:CCG84431.1 protein of unknown function [Taphrina deformans PYCC 5710]